MCDLQGGAVVTKQRARVGVVGAGLHGEMHLIAYSTYDRAELVVICDTNEDRARKMALNYDCEWTTDINELVGANIDGVSIATPDFAHAEPALAAMTAGKHVLLEKPLSTSVVEGQRIVDAARLHGVKLMVNLSNRWHPKYIAAKDAIASGQIGELIMGYARLSNQISVPTTMLSWSAQSGPEWFLFPHTMDLMRWFMEREATRVVASGRKGVLTELGIDAYDAVQALVNFGDAFATFETSWIIPNSFPTVTDSTMSLYGTDGRIEIDNNVQGLTITAERFDPRVPYGKFVSHGGKQMGYYLEGIRHFVDCILDDLQPLVSGDDGLAVVKMIDAVRQSILNRCPVDL